MLWDHYLLKFSRIDLYLFYFAFFLCMVSKINMNFNSIFTWSASCMSGTTNWFSSYWKINLNWWRPLVWEYNSLNSFISFEWVGYWSWYLILFWVSIVAIFLTFNSKLFQYCIYIYVNGKMRPVKTVPGMGEGCNKWDDGGGWVNSTMIYLIYCKNFCECHNVPPAQQ
jgi:hypothetical protein